MKFAEKKIGKMPTDRNKTLKVCNDQEKAQSERDSHSKHRGGKTKLTIRYLYFENIS